LKGMTSFAVLVYEHIFMCPCTVQKAELAPALSAFL